VTLAAEMNPKERPGRMFWRLRLKHLLLANAVMLMLAALYYGLQGNVYALAKEGRIPTWISVLQLLAIAYTCYRIYLDRREHATNGGGYRLWLVMAVGFVYLALDEKTLIHESLDKRIHAFFAIHQTVLSDSIDDAIVNHRRNSAIWVPPRNNTFRGARPIPGGRLFAFLDDDGHRLFD
jgi:hypothetical protein